MGKVAVAVTGVLALGAVGGAIYFGARKAAPKIPTGTKLPARQYAPPTGNSFGQLLGLNIAKQLVPIVAENLSVPSPPYSNSWSPEPTLEPITVDDSLSAIPSDINWGDI